MNKKIKYYCFFGLVYFFIVFLSSCASEINEPAKEESIKYRYGYDESKYLFEERKVRSGDTFGDILA